MCQECIDDFVAAGANDVMVESLKALFGLNDVVDYFAEYRTESEADLSGDGLNGPWKVSVAKVGGGTVGKTYPAGEQWIIQRYQGDVLVESAVAEARVPKTHAEVLQEFSETWIG